MDDYSVSSLSESKNEWCARLVDILTMPVIDGLRSIFKESWELCISNDEEDKYLMTFQTLLSRIPKWNPEIIANERKRIEDVSNCSYLEDLISCVHVIQLKALTCVRVGQKQKKIDIDIPNAESFIHKIYIILARKLYTSVYLFENNIAPLDVQRNNREIEILTRESIMEAIRDTMPIETILRAYMDETDEQNIDVEENIIETPIVTSEKSEKISTPVDVSPKENIELVVEDKASIDVTKVDTVGEPSLGALPGPVVAEPEPVSAPVPAAPVAPAPSLAAPALAAPVSAAPVSAAPALALAHAVAVPSMSSISTVASPTAASLAFSDVDKAVDINGKESQISAPKTPERLEKIAIEANERRKQEEEDDDEQLQIGDEIKLELGDINDLNSAISVNPPVLDDIEVLT